MANAQDFWKILEEEIVFDIPNYIKNAFNCCNFSNRLNFESLTEDEINQIEQIVREKGVDYVEKIVNSPDQMFTDEQLIASFGETYASDPSNFRFEIGDRKLIRIVRDHLIKQKNEKGLKYLRRFRKKTNNQNPKKMKFDQDNLGAIENKGENACALKEEKIINDDDDFCQQMSVSLFERLKVFMGTYDIDDSIIQSIDPNMASVQIGEKGFVYKVWCVVCKNDSTKKKRKLKGHKVSYKSGEKSSFWILSNLGTHLRDFHKMKPRVKERYDENDTLHAEDIAVAIASDAAVNNCDETLAAAHNFSVEYFNDYASSEQKTNSSGSNPIYDQITLQITKMIAAILSNSDKTDQMYFKLIEDERKLLKIAQIARDGSCLFSSIAHQLYSYKIGSHSHTNATNRLRESVCKYISSHYSSFKHMLQGRVYEEINAESIIDLDKECKTILEQYLPMRGYWGGAETLKAVQEMHHVNILIFNEHGPCYFFNSFNEAHTQTLILAFRFTHSSERNHYDSVCDIPSQEILDSISYLSTKLEEANEFIDQTL